jgi:Na+-driven multidrug efflux pump
VVAAYGVGNQVTHFGIAILVGIGLGLSSLIGHTIGSGKLDRAKKTADHAVLLGISIMTVFGVIVFIFARQMMGLFFDSAETIGYGVTMLKIFALAFPFLGAFFMMEEVHVGVGMNSPAMVMNILYAWPLQVLPIYIFTQVMHLDVAAIWWTIGASFVVGTTLFYFYYRRGRWMTVSV